MADCEKFLLQMFELADGITDQLDRIADKQLAVAGELKAIVVLNMELLKQYDVALMERAMTTQLDYQDVEKFFQIMNELTRLRGPVNDMVRTLRRAERERTERFVTARQAGVSEGELRS